MKISEEIYKSEDFGDKISRNSRYRYLIPDLSEDEKERLEKNLRKYGCREFIYIDNSWNIVDGEHRVTICKEHKIPFLIKEITFDSEDEKIEWIIENQLGRRNLDNQNRNYLIGILNSKYRWKKEFSKENNDVDENESANFALVKTAELIAKEYNISRRSLFNCIDYAKGLEEIRIGLNDIEVDFGNNCVLKGDIGLTNEEVMNFADFDLDKKTEAVIKLYEDLKGNKKVSENTRYIFKKEKEIRLIEEIKSAEGIRKTSDKLREFTIENIISEMKPVKTYYSYENQNFKIRIYLKQ